MEVMSTRLNVMNSDSVDLSICDEFMEYYHTGNSFTQHIIEKEINNGHYNDPDFKKIFDNNDAVIIDGGANIGLFALHLFKACKKIYAVEPTVKHLNVLRILSEKLKIDNIEFCEVAFNNYNGECSFIVDESNTTQNRIEQGGNTVKCQTIIDFIKSLNEPSIDLLKIDIEGGERFSILEDPTFDDVAPFCKNIYIEIHPPFVNPIDIVNKFSSMGYKIKFINSQFLNNNLNILAYR
jgi:FkbM family methyltransferase